MLKSDGREFFNWIPSIITPADNVAITTNHYRNACNIILAGGKVFGPNFAVTPNLRDRCGFCYPSAIIEGHSSLIGFTDNLRRPGIVIQKFDDLEFPKGNVTVILPSKTKVTFTKGAYLIDAEVFDEFLIGQSLHAVL